MDAQVFGRFVQQRRKELGLSQAELAERLHVTAKAVSRWERGVGFPDIKLLEPLAGALEITLVELMQSKRMEAELPKETAAELVSNTVCSMQEQEKLSWKRRLTLYGCYIALFAVYLFLGYVAREYLLEPRWVGAAVVFIGSLVYYYGIRLIRCYITGEPFFPKRHPMWRRKRNWLAAGIVVTAFVVFLVIAVVFQGEKSRLRDTALVISLMLVWGGAMYLNQQYENPSE